MNEALYTIVTTSRGHRVLVARAPITEGWGELRYDDFDAMLLTATVQRTMEEMVFALNPVTEGLFALKPLYVATPFENTRFEMQPLVDGYADSPEDEGLARSIEHVEQVRRELGLQPLEQEMSRGAYWFLRVLRYLMARGKENASLVSLDAASSRGYSRPLFEIFYRRGYYRSVEIDETINQFIGKGYLMRGRFYDKIHLCPECLHSHLLFLETCPKCGSSDINEDMVIHHFPCANVSPESTYYFDGKLRCPKCNQFLRHIGVDYDRPASVYHCNACSANFGQPIMQALCTRCSKRHEPEVLAAYDVYDFRMTESGRRTLAARDVVSGENDLSRFEGLFSFVHFTRFIERRVQLAASEQRDLSFFVLRFLIASNSADPKSNEELELISSAIYNQFYRHYITFLNSRFMVLSIPISSKTAEKRRPDVDEEEDFARRARTIVAELQVALPREYDVSFDVVRFQSGQSITDFIRNLDS